MVELGTRLAIERARTVTLHLKLARWSSIPTRVKPGGFQELRQTLDLESEQVQTPDGFIVPIHSGIRVNIYSPRANEDVPTDLALTSPLPRTFHYGDRIRFLT
jgi:hypothetical protein